MLLISCLLLGLSTRALVYADPTITITHAPFPTLPGNNGIGFCDNLAGYDNCAYPIIQCPTQTPDASTCGCSQAKRDINCWTSFCPSYTVSNDYLGVFLLASSIWCDGIDNSLAGAFPTGAAASASASDGGIELTASPTPDTSSPKSTAVAKTGTGSGLTSVTKTASGTGSSSATVAATTSKAAADRVMRMGTAPVVGGVLGLFVGVVGLIL